MHPPVFIPDSARLGSVLKQMQASRTHLACVVDEHGGLEGIITLEDLLEEIVGEIDDEFDEEVREQIVKEGDSYVLSGRLVVRDANRVLRLQLPEHEGFNTIAGFLHGPGRPALNEGDAVSYNGAKFIVERLEGRRIRRVRFTPHISNAPTSSSAAGTHDVSAVICFLTGSVWLT